VHRGLMAGDHSAALGFGLLKAEHVLAIA
jgi:hypothetical protein